MREWATFLEGFAGLKFLRRLELSGNPLGDVGIEILFRTYAFEKEIFIPYDFKAATKADVGDEYIDADYSVEGFDIRSSGGHLYLATHQPQGIEVEANGLEAARKISIGTNSTQISTTLSSSPPSSFEQSRDQADIHGLRGIPYIVMSNIGATDLSALWLSYIIAEHPLPSELLPYLPPLKEGALAATLRKYDSLPNCRGIVLNENPAVTVLGLRVLKEAEERRDEDAARVEELITNGRGRRRSSVTSDTGSDEVARRDSILNSSLQDESYTARIRKNLIEHRYNLDRTRAKIQLNVLKERGIESSLLWSRAMRMIVVGRAILLDYNGPIVIDGFEPTIQIEVKCM
ncbi:hypothetical protein ABW19_dt0202021 [Dactylella cylindrospora]|nr:hypothetical protein ABW19_dt0202021 [Dactylella cylindrospora]